MLFKKINILFILSLFCCLKLKAQDSTLMGKTIKWDLVQCIEYAKKNNIQINTLRLSQLTSQQEYLLAKAARLPNLSGSATQYFEHSKGSSARVDANGNVVSAGRSGFAASGSYGLNSSVTLYNGGYLNNTILQKNLAMQA